MAGQEGGSPCHSRRDKKKAVVENCLALDANRWMRDRILVEGIHHAGACNWHDSRSGEQTSSIAFEVCTLDAARPWLGLRYQLPQSGEAMNYTVRLTTTRPRFGGLRWWFTCPVVVNHQACGRRVGKLYLPPGARNFGCRQCHELTYTSCQESRKYDSLCRHMALHTGRDFASVKRTMKRLAK
jgi:hypothetical protein